MPALYSGDQPLNKSQIQRLTGHTYYIIDKAIDELGTRPFIDPGAANQLRFTADQVRAIQNKIEELLQRKIG